MPLRKLGQISFILKRRKPRLTMKLIAINLKILLFKQVPPFRQVEIQTTFACNLNCIHCSAANFKPTPDMLTLADFREIARQCKQYKVPMVSFTGGEPLFDPRIEDIIRCFDTKSTLISITTNGTLLTPERAKRLKAIGVDSFVISLDGPDPETNDPIRGEGTFEKIMDALQVAKSHGFFVMLIHTLFHQSIESGNFDKLIKLTQSLEVPLHVSLASPTGNWADDEAMKQFILTKQDIDYLWQSQEKYPCLRRDLDGNYLQHGCPAATERFVISPVGDVLPCTKIQAAFGNVKNESMYAIRQRMTSMDIFSAYPPLCLVAEDGKFLNTYLPGVFDRNDLPISYEEYFGEDASTSQHCPACQSSNFCRRYDQLLDYEYHVPISPALLQCRSCGLIRHENLPTYDDLNAFYPDDYLVYNESFRAGSNALFARLKKILYAKRAKRVAKHIGKTGNILDVGCANGAFLISVKQHGDYGLYGLDIKNTGVDFEKHSIHFKEGPLEEIDYPENFFDAVILDNLLEHVPDPVSFMKKVWSILKPGGCVFGTTPNFNSVDRFLFGKYWGGFHMPRHIFLFSASNLKIFLKKMGFSDIKLPPTTNAGDWAVSFQNFFRRNQQKQGRYKRGKYFPIIGLIFAPIAFFTSLFNLNGVMDFICRKEESKS